MLVRHAEKDPFRLRIVVRRALAGKIRQKEQRRHIDARPLRLGQQRRHIGTAGQRRRPVQAGRRAEHHRHQMPAVRQRVTKTVNCAFRVRQETVAYDEIDAGRAQRQHALSGVNHAGAYRARGIIAAARHHRHAFHAPALRQRRLQIAGNLVALEQRRHLRLRQPAGLQQGIAPAAIRHVQPKRARRIGHIAGEVAGQTPAQIIFRQQHLRDT